MGLFLKIYNNKAVKWRQTEKRTIMDRCQRFKSPFPRDTQGSELEIADLHSANLGA